jgi:hypothetical protein
MLSTLVTTFGTGKWSSASTICNPPVALQTIQIDSLPMGMLDATTIMHDSQKSYNSLKEKNVEQFNPTCPTLDQR